MIAIITAIISGIAMSVQGVFNTRLGEKIGVWETNVFVQGSALILTLIITFFIQKFVVQFITSHNLYNVSHQITNQMKVENILSSLLFPGQFVAVSILAPILEESIYRACFYKLFGYYRWTFFLSCFFFSYVHSGFSWDILGYLPLSIALTYVYHRRQVLTDSILLHALFNTLLFVF